MRPHNFERVGFDHIQLVHGDGSHIFHLAQARAPVRSAVGSQTGRDVRATVPIWGMISIALVSHLSLSGRSTT